MHASDRFSASGTKAIRVLLSTLLVYALLVATHEGEFWPFSIYPMFSQAGRPWSRTVVRDVDQTPDDVLWRTVAQSELPGHPVGLAAHGIAAEDIANYVSKTTSWDRDRLLGLQKIFTTSGLSDRALLVMKVEGRLTEDDSVSIRCIPYVWIRGDSVASNPNLDLE